MTSNKEDWYMEDGQRKIFEFRQKHKLSVQELADLLRVPYNTVYRWESNLQRPKLLVETALLGVVVKLKAKKIREERGQ